METTSLPLTPVRRGSLIISALGMLLAFFGTTVVTADDYPAKPVRIVAASPGTGSDFCARYVGQKLNERWGKPVVVENRGGGSAAIAATSVARASADGYTLLMGETASLATAPTLYKIEYNPVKDFAPITLVASAPLVVVAHPSVPAANLREFIAYAKQRPHDLNYSAGGSGTVAHLTSALLNLLAGIDVVYVPYKGAGAALLAVVGGEVQVSSLSATVAVPQVKTGKLKAYAVTAKKRFPTLPEVPTGAEAGLPRFESEVWFGLVAPARAPAALVSRLNREVVDILKTPATAAAFLLQGTQPAPTTQVQFGQFIQTEIPKWAAVIKAAGVAVE